MHIQLNGERFELPDGQSVADLLQRLELTGRRLAVELNREIVPRSQQPRRRWSRATRLKSYMRLAAADEPAASIIPGRRPCSGVFHASFDLYRMVA